MPIPEGAIAAQFALKRFGAPTSVRERVVNVTTVPIELLPPNPRRVAWLAQNRGVNDGALSFSRDVAFTTGLRVANTTGHVALDVETDGEVVTYAVYAVQNVAAENWWVYEVVAL